MEDKNLERKETDLICQDGNRFLINQRYLALDYLRNRNTLLPSIKASRSIYNLIRL